MAFVSWFYWRHIGLQPKRLKGENFMINFTRALQFDSIQALPIEKPKGPLEHVRSLALRDSRVEIYRFSAYKTHSYFSDVILYKLW